MTCATPWIKYKMTLLECSQQQGIVGLLWPSVFSRGWTGVREIDLCTRNNVERWSLGQEPSLSDESQRTSSLWCMAWRRVAFWLYLVGYGGRLLVVVATDDIQGFTKEWDIKQTFKKQNVYVGRPGWLIRKYMQFLTSGLWVQSPHWV